MVYDGDRILVQNKVNDDWTGLCFPGGHVENRESFVKSVIREIKGLGLTSMSSCGVKQFYTEKMSASIVFLHKTNRFEGASVIRRRRSVLDYNREDFDSYSWL